MSYRIVRSLIIKALYLYYDEIIVTGAENIPAKGGYIFAPNHRNALMDALAVVLITPKEKSTTFLARADIFKNKFVAKILRFSKIMPAFRIRDGFENLGKNNEVFEECVELLEANQALCIMPEGNQEMPHHVRPLVKGIFRVAFSVQQRNKTEFPLQILPVGFDYGDPVKFGKHLIINIGEPIDVSTYSEAYIENPPKALNEIKDELKLRLEQLTLHIDSEKHENTILSATEFAQYKILKNKGLTPNTLALYTIRKQLSDNLSEFENYYPEQFVELEAACNQYESLLKKHRLQSRNLEFPKSLTTILVNCLLLIVSFPFAIAGFAMNVLPFFMPVWIRKMLKVEFIGFYSSIQFVLGLILIPIIYLIQSVFICNFITIPLLYLPFILVTHLFTGILSFKYYSLLKCSIASVRYKLLPEKERTKLKSLRNAIVKKVI